MAEQVRKVRELETDASGILLPFKTKNGKYNIIRPGDALGISRFTQWEKLSIVGGVGKSFSAIADALKNIETLLGADRPFAEIRTEAILAVNSMRRGIVELSAERYNQGLYLASIFIWKEGTDPLEWDYNTATEWIQDWQEEGLSEVGFFSFALATVSGFQKRYSELKAAVEREAGALSAVSSLTKPGKAAL